MKSYIWTNEGKILFKSDSNAKLLLLIFLIILIRPVDGKGWVMSFLELCFICWGHYESILFIEDTARSKQKNKSKSNETPLPLYMGFMVCPGTRKENLIEDLDEYGLSISYKRIFEISLTSYANCTMFKDLHALQDCKRTN